MLTEVGGEEQPSLPVGNEKMALGAVQCRLRGSVGMGAAH